MSRRHTVVVDVETNGLDLERHQAIEVAWWNLDTDQRGCFVPAHNISEVLGTADVRALQVNRYIDRIPGSVYTQKWIDVLDVMVGNLMGDDGEGATLAGSNPRFDAAMLSKLILRTNDDHDTALDHEPWHHRLFDLSAYAAGVLGLDYLPGLAATCELLGVEAPDHTADGDVTATGLCFRELQKRAIR